MDKRNLTGYTKKKLHDINWGSVVISETTTHKDSKYGREIKEEYIRSSRYIIE